jgi:hypothetical protein
MIMGALERHTTLILRLTAAATMGTVLVFIAPTIAFKTLGVTIEDDTALLLVRHWGLVVFCLGGLLFYTANNLELRVPVLIAVTMEKLAIVLLLAMNWADPRIFGLRPAAVFDGLCVLLFLVILWRGKP